MSLDAYDVRCGLPERVDYIVRMTGTGASVPTQNYPSTSSGVALARTSAGLFTLTWTDNPGNYIGISGHSFGGTTSINMIDHNLTETGWVSSGTSHVLTFTVDDGTAVDDLEATEFLTMTISFQRSGLG